MNESNFKLKLEIVEKQDPAWVAWIFINLEPLTATHIHSAMQFCTVGPGDWQACMGGPRNMQNNLKLVAETDQKAPDRQS